MDIGDTIDRYVVEDIIGRGGVATVYLLRHKRLNSPHALKVLHASSQAIQDRLVREATAQANLRHRNVVHVTDLLEVEGDPGIVMEYVDGPSLEALLARERPPIEEGLRIFREVVEGVAHAHAHGWIHRDLKPGNILLTSPVSGSVPKICDFGLVKVVEADPLMSGRTHQGVAMGTPGYMAPEQIRDAAGVDQRADMFSLGAVLYELVTGMRTFNGSTVLAILNKVARGEYAPPEEYVPDLSPGISKLIADLLETDPEERLADCQQILWALDRVRTELASRRTVELSPGNQHLSPPEVGSSRVSSTEAVALGAVTLALLVALALPTPADNAPPIAPATAPLTTLVAVAEDADDDEEEDAATDAEDPDQEVDAAEEEADPEPPPPPANLGPQAWPGKARTGRVVIRGAGEVWLTDGQKRYRPGNVPPGAYDVVVWFGGTRWEHAGRIRVRVGKDVTVQCDWAKKKCR